jgi:hypothetical protein
VGQQAHDLSQRGAAGLIPVDRATLRYEHHRDPQDGLRVTDAYNSVETNLNIS